MRLIFCLLLCLLVSALHAQVSINVYEMETEVGYDIFINNEEYTPVTVVLKYELLNLKSSVGKEVKLLVPAREQNFAAGSLSIIDLRKPYQFRYEYETNIGNHGQVNYRCVANFLKEQEEEKRSSSVGLDFVFPSLR